MNTKQIGTVAEAKVKANLLAKGFNVAEPEGDYLPFDLVVITKDLRMYKVQVKSGKIKKSGSVNLKLIRNRYEKGRYKHDIRYEEGDVDIFALYVFDLDSCFYIKADEIKQHKYCICFRVNPAKGSQTGREFRMLKDYENMLL